MTFVERTDDGRNIGLEQTHADDDGGKSEVEHCRASWNGEQEVSSCDEDAAPVHGASLTDQSIGDPTSGEREQEHGTRIETVDRAGGFAVHAETRVDVARCGHEEQHEQGAHAVIGEAFEEFGHEQGCKTPRVAEKGFFVRVVHAVSPDSVLRMRFIRRAITMPPS